MAKKKTDDETTPGFSSQMLRAPAEVLYAAELDQLIKDDKYDRPPGWRMSARAVQTYICGGKSGSMEITPKYIGHQRLVEIAISTLVTDRSLLLLGEPGTAKSWLSEHLAAAINGDSTKVVQGTAGTTEEQIRYSWNYAMLIARWSPSHDALIRSPIFRRHGVGHAGFLRGNHPLQPPRYRTRSFRSSRRSVSPSPELATEVPANKGFSIIATASTPAIAASTTCRPPSNAAST